MKRSVLFIWMLSIGSACKGNAPVHDFIGYTGKLIDDAIEMVQFMEEVEGTYLSVKNTYEQLQKMEDFQDKFGAAGMFQYDTKTFHVSKLRRDLESSRNTITDVGDGGGSVVRSIKDKYYSTFDRANFMVKKKGQELEATDAEMEARKELLNAIHRIAKERNKIAEELASLAEAAKNAKSDQELAKLSTMADLHRARLAILEQEVRDLEEYAKQHRIEMDIQKKIEKIRQMKRIDYLKEEYRKVDLKPSSRKVLDLCRDIERVRL